MYEENTFEAHLPCPSCGSSDANALYSDGHLFCHKCKTRIRSSQNGEDMLLDLPQSTPPPKKFSTGSFGDISDRKISKETCRKYNTYLKKNGTTITHHIYQYFDKDGHHIANKVRSTEDKKFWTEGPINSGVLFGQNIFNQGGKFVTICEGELDAMSAYEMLGSKWPVISIKNGAAAASENCKKSLDYLNRFDSIVLCFDNDKQGKEAEK